MMSEYPASFSHPNDKDWKGEKVEKAMRLVRHEFAPQTIPNVSRFTDRVIQDAVGGEADHNLKRIQIDPPQGARPPDM